MLIFDAFKSLCWHFLTIIIFFFKSLLIWPGKRATIRYRLSTCIVGVSIWSDMPNTMRYGWYVLVSTDILYLDLFLDDWFLYIHDELFIVIQYAWYNCQTVYGKISYNIKHVMHMYNVARIRIRIRRMRHNTVRTQHLFWCPMYFGVSVVRPVHVYASETTQLRFWTVHVSYHM